MTHDDRPICDHQVDMDDSTWFECELPMHHPGPHKYTFTWENEPYGPQLPPSPRPSRLLSEAWAKDIEEALVRSLVRRPPGRVL